MFLLIQVNFSCEETLASYGRIVAAFLFSVFTNLKAKFGGHFLLTVAGSTAKTVYSHLLFY